MVATSGTGDRYGDRQKRTVVASRPLFAGAGLLGWVRHRTGCGGVDVLWCGVASLRTNWTFLVAWLRDLCLAWFLVSCPPQSQGTRTGSSPAITPRRAGDCTNTACAYRQP